MGHSTHTYRESAGEDFRGDDLWVAVRADDGRIVAADNLEIRGRDVIYHDDLAASRVNYTKVRRPAV